MFAPCKSPHMKNKLLQALILCILIIPSSFADSTEIKAIGNSALKPTTDHLTRDYLKYYRESFRSSSSTLSKEQKLKQKADVAIADENWDLASEYLNKSLKRDSESPLGYLGFAKFHSARGEYAYAETALVKGLEFNPDDHRLLFEYSKILVLKGDLEGALVRAAKAVDRDRPHWLHLEWLSELHIANGDMETGKTVLNQSIQALRANLMAVRHRIGYYERQSRYTAQTIDWGFYDNLDVDSFKVSPVSISEKRKAPEVMYAAKDSLRRKLEQLKSRFATI